MLLLPENNVTYKAACILHHNVRDADLCICTLSLVETVFLLHISETRRKRKHTCVSGFMRFWSSGG